MENQMLKMVVQRTYDLLAHHHNQEKDDVKEIDKALDNVYEALKQNMHLVRK
jgi:hypothetical protein